MPARINVPVEAMAARYEAGESTRALARVYGVCQATVWRRLFAAGVTMRPSGAPPGNEYSLGYKNALGNKSKLGQHKRGGPLHISHGYLCTYDHEGKQCRVHRGCWEAYHGAISDGYVVHHIDEDRLNNAVENLSRMTNGEHAALHNREQESLGVGDDT